MERFDKWSYYKFKATGKDSPFLVFKGHVGEYVEMEERPTRIRHLVKPDEVYFYRDMADYD